KGLVNDFFAGMKSAAKEGDRVTGLGLERIKLIRKLRDSIDNKQLFQHLRDSIVRAGNIAKKNVYRQKTEKIKSILQASLLVKIDDQTINPNRISSHFYYHPDAHTEGLLYYFPLDSLAIGAHHYTFGKIRGQQKNEDDRQYFLDTTYYIVPFIYTGK
ncbi:MAG: hypothetical protein AAGJ18_08580, partial [Bacteroidota bacterium]